MFRLDDIIWQKSGTLVDISGDQRFDVPRGIEVSRLGLGSNDRDADVVALSGQVPVADPDQVIPAHVPKPPPMLQENLIRNSGEERAEAANARKNWSVNGLENPELGLGDVAVAEVPRFRDPVG